MKIAIYISALILLTGCGNNTQQHLQQATRVDTIIIRDTVYFHKNPIKWQEGFGLTHDPDKDSIWGKPASYYLDDKNCNGIALDFYYGQMHPSDNGATEELLKLAYTDDQKLRPYYRWCLDKTIEIQDGALTELTGIPARLYAEKFPKEFFEFMDSDKSGNRYKEWVSSIGYSGFYDRDDYKKPKEIQERMITAMKSNCKNCEKKTMLRIGQFAKDCFD